jgi:predicted ArsR family transcriptional regulator
MREQYPNAYRPWKEQEDSELTELFTAKGTVGLDELAKKFGRHPGSIRARLQKLFGEDAVI